MSKTVFDPRNEHRARYRQHRDRADALITEHAQLAMTETGGRLRAAARIYLARVKADALLQTELNALDQLWRLSRQRGQ
jgi:hypothetical protein